MSLLERSLNLGHLNLLDHRFENILSPDLLQEDIQMIKEYSMQNSLKFKAKLLPITSVPYVISQAKHKAFVKIFHRLHAVIEIAIDRLLRSPSLFEKLSLPPQIKSLIEIENGYRPRVAFCRFDFTIDEKGYPKIYEINSDCPGGAIFSYHLYRILKKK